MLSRLSNFVVRATGAANRFAITTGDWGFGAALHEALIARFGGEHRFRLRTTGSVFRYRGRRDAAVLHFLSADSGYIETRPDRPVRHIVDAGGNIGLFSALARAHYPQAEIVALEIDTDNYAVLRDNVAALDGEAWPLALWGRSGLVSFVEGESAQAHSVVAVAERATAPSIEAIGLADLMARKGWDRVSILKMDIEGAEGPVMRDMDAATLARIDAIIFECNDSERAGASVDVVGRLLGDEFDGFAFGENVYLVRRSTGWTFRRHAAGIRPMWRQA